MVFYIYCKRFLLTDINFQTKTDMNIQINHYIKRSSKYFLLTSTMLLFSTFTSCFITGNFHTAKLLESKNYDITPSSTLTFINESNDGTFCYAFGLSGRYGISKRFNIGCNYYRINLSDYLIGYNYVSPELFLGIIQDHIALSLSEGLYFGHNVEYTESVNICPELILSFPLSSVIDVTLSPACTFFVPGFNKLFSINLSLSYTCRNKQISFIPEIGFSFDDSNNNHYYFAGIGITFINPFNSLLKHDTH